MAQPSCQVHVVDHPLIASSLTVLRDERTSCENFRKHLRLVARLMTFSITGDLATDAVQVTTPLTETTGARLRAPLVVAPILRAGLGMADGIIDMVPDVLVAHIGLYRDEETLEPKPYYESFPNELAEADVLLVDPMLATGGSSIAGADLLKTNGAASIRFLNLVSAQAGINAFHRVHPDIPIYTAAIDPDLNDKAYIVPGLGDAGDRFFGTV